GQAGTELAATNLAKQVDRQDQDPRDQRHGQHAVQYEQQVILLGVARSISRRPYQQAEQCQRADRGNDQRGAQHPAHQRRGSPTDTENVNSFHGVVRDQALLLRALTWKGRARCEVSSRNRIWPVYMVSASRLLDAVMSQLRMCRTSVRASSSDGAGRDRSPVPTRHW